MTNQLYELLRQREYVPSERQNPRADDPRWKILGDLQNNILSGHHKKNARYWFLEFSDEPERARLLLGLLSKNRAERAIFLSALPDAAVQRELPPALQRALSDHSLARALSGPGRGALVQDLRLLSEREVRREEPPPEEFPPARRRRAAPLTRATSSAPPEVEYVLSLLLSESGYRALGLTPPEDAAFRRGPLPLPGEVRREPTRLERADALLLVAYDDDASPGALEAFEALVRACTKHLHEERGQTLRNEADIALEPFGFADGTSQPRFYENSANAPAEPLEIVLTADPHGRTPFACGSYFVFQKLEQDIQLFYSQVHAIAERTNRTPEDVAASIIGRDRQGGSLITKSPHTPPSEDATHIDFAADPHGLVCPFHSHVRRVNPRSDVRPFERRLIVRRGLPYGDPIKRKPSGEPMLTPKFEVVPQGKVKKATQAGLLFLCAQSSIGDQFEHIQEQWTNNPHFPWSKTTGVDPIIGHAANPSARRFQSVHHAEDGKPYTKGVDTDWSPVVTHLGTRYFFAPSLSFLRGLLDDLLQHSSSSGDLP